MAHCTGIALRAFQMIHIDEIGTVASTDTVGENLWRSPELKHLPDHSRLFFPRARYALLASPSGRTVYVLGGSQGSLYKNDVWKLRLSAQGISWIALSQEYLSSYEEGDEVQAKWCGRESLAACAAYESSAARPPDAMYVVGGFGAAGLLADVWVSSDGGNTWMRRCRNAPWGERADPGLVAVRGHYDRVVLCGGKGRNDYGPEMKSDLWISDDAGGSWFEIETPSWDARCLPLLFSFKPGEASTSKLLIMGGKRAEEMWSGGTVAVTPFLHDAWQVEIDINTRTGHWEQLRTLDEAINERPAPPGLVLCQESASLDCADLERPRIVRLNKGRIWTGLPRPPYVWQCLGEPLSENTLCKLGTLTRVLLSPGLSNTCPRLFVFGDAGAAASGTGALTWQRAFLQQVGSALEHNKGLPFGLWTERVVPNILPCPSPSPTPSRNRAA